MVNFLQQEEADLLISKKKNIIKHMKKMLVSKETKKKPLNKNYKKKNHIFL